MICMTRMPRIHRHRARPELLVVRNRTEFVRDKYLGIFSALGPKLVR